MTFVNGIANSSFVSTPCLWHIWLITRMGIRKSWKSFSLTWASCSFWYSLTFTSSCACSRFHFCAILAICYRNSQALISIPAAFCRRTRGAGGRAPPQRSLLGGDATNTRSSGEAAHGMLVKTLILNMHITEYSPNRNRHAIWLQKQPSQLHMKLRIQNTEGVLHHSTIVIALSTAARCVSAVRSGQLPFYLFQLHTAITLLLHQESLQSPSQQIEQTWQPCLRVKELHFSIEMWQEARCTKRVHQVLFDLQHLYVA